MLTINNMAQSLAGANMIGEITRNIESVSKQLSSGKRITSSAVDPSGMVIASGLKSDYRSYGAVSKNITSGQSVLQAGESALGGVRSLLTEMRDMAVTAANDTLTADARTAINTSFSEFQGQITDIVNAAEVNGNSLVSATAADIDLQTGINAGDKTTLTSSASDAASLGVDAGTIDLTDIAKSGLSITAIDAAIAEVDLNIATIGAQSSGLSIRSNTVDDLMSNIESARSRIEDVDVAKASSELATLQVREQSAVAMLGLVNSLPQNALSLLRF